MGCAESLALQADNPGAVARDQRRAESKELAAHTRGWKGYFGLCQTPLVLEVLDDWIRRRLRSEVWKQ